jgi:hypothetical protein
MRKPLALGGLMHGNTMKLTLHQTIYPGQWSLLCPGQWKGPASSQTATKPEIQQNIVTAALFTNSVQKW